MRKLRHTPLSRKPLRGLRKLMDQAEADEEATGLYSHHYRQKIEAWFTKQIPIALKKIGLVIENPKIMFCICPDKRNSAWECVVDYDLWEKQKIPKLPCLFCKHEH